MNVSLIAIRTRDNCTYQFENVKFAIRDDILVIEEYSKNTCFPIGNVICYTFKKMR